MTDERIIAYLLLELPEDERERFEDECFLEQPSWPAELSLVEEDLIDAYLRNELTPERRERFEKNYLTTEARLDQVAAATALLRHADKLHESKASLGVKVMEPTWGTRISTFWSAQTPMIRAIAAILPIAIFTGILALISHKPEAPNIVGVSVTFSNGQRGDRTDVQRISLPHNVDALKLFMMLPRQSAPASTYSAELRNEDGKTTQVEVAIQDDQTLVGTIPAKHLGSGSYILKLFTTRSDGTEEPVPGGYLLGIE